MRRNPHTNVDNNVDDVWSEADGITVEMTAPVFQLYKRVSELYLWIGTDNLFFFHTDLLHLYNDLHKNIQVYSSEALCKGNVS